MSTGWRRAFCTRDPESSLSDNKEQPISPNPRSCGRLNFFSNPSTPRLHQSQSQSQSPSLRCRTIAEAAQAAIKNESPRIQNKTTPRSFNSPKTLSTSNPSSHRTPLKLSLFKNSFKFRSNCGICLNSVKTGKGTAIYTAECSHAFHFPCIASHVRNHGSLVCPVCNATWKDVPLLVAHKNENDVVSIEKTRIESSSSVSKTNHVQPPQQKHVSDSVRSYDDDEPLLSPRFVPIPEADENGDEAQQQNDDVEFQGFFVDPKPSSSVKSYSDEQQINNGDSRTVEVKLMPECAIVSVSRSYESYALVLKVKAPPPPPPPPIRSGGAPVLDPSQRAPIDLVTVLGIGGSMTGVKLEMLKRSMRLVISSLGSCDRLSIVAFSAIPKRLLPLRRMTPQGQRMARRIVDRLVSVAGNGTTSVGDALRKATKVLEDRRERNPVASVMLLSDGQDERVQTSTKSNQRKNMSHVSSTRFAHIEIPVQSFGFGRTETGEEDAFAKCVGGILSVVVQDLRIQLGFQTDSGELIAVYSCNGRPTLLSSRAVRLGDLYAEEERDLLIELRVPLSSFENGTHHAMKLRYCFKDPATQEIVYGKEQSLIVPPPQSNRSNRIERLRNLFIATRAIAESRRLMEHNGDLNSAHHLLASARALLVQSGSGLDSDSSIEYVRRLEAELAQVEWRRQNQAEKENVQKEREVAALEDENGEPLTPTSAWRAAEKLAKMAMIKKSLNRVSDLHGFENARF
ncbi:hypothetical protein TanjilG_15660 [Lupinus angustifolius]|uniref:RING-type domain-containing protein n=1 Tax=Lupinus angustifolius TaxID=3871 RepID=A0A1J7IW85_LUPAN|nr:PREDICTED: uncharacterized protein LOC109334425 [Lupinus angustifolius]OIW17077.1 hypothetical protein TanjilG_15660 [Lupinus angustifolius]